MESENEVAGADAPVPETKPTKSEHIGQEMAYGLIWLHGMYDDPETATLGAQNHKLVAVAGELIRQREETGIPVHVLVSGEPPRDSERASLAVQLWTQLAASEGHDVSRWDVELLEMPLGYVFRDLAMREFWPQTVQLVVTAAYVQNNLKAYNLRPLLDFYEDFGRRVRVVASA